MKSSRTGDEPVDAYRRVVYGGGLSGSGWAAFKIGRFAFGFSGYGLGSYSFFNQGVDIFAAHAFEVPTTLPAGSLHDLLTIFLDPSVGSGGILNVVNETGGPSTIANPDVPVTVVNFP